MGVGVGVGVGVEWGFKVVFESFSVILVNSDFDF